MFKRVFLLTLVGAAVAVTSGAAQHPTLSTRVKQQASAPAYNPNLVILYDQNNNADPNGNAVSAQNFEAVYNAYDDFLADDFFTPSNQRWGIQQIDAPGVYFNGAGPVTSFNVFIHKTNAGLPKDPPNPTATRLNQTYSVVGNIFRINVSPTISIPAGQHLYLDVQANMNFNPNGQWGWGLRTVQAGNASAWENPGGGFGICPTWGIMQTCIGLTGVPDLLFTIYGFHTFAE